MDRHLIVYFAYLRTASAATALLLCSIYSVAAYDPSQYLIQPYKTLETDKIIIRSPGSTGDVAGMRATGTGSLIGQVLMRRFSEAPSVVDYGVDMSGVANSTSAFTAALNSGKPVTAPCGTIRLLSTVSVTALANFRGAGSCTVLQYDAPAGSAIAPILDIRPSAVGTVLQDFSFDHRANVRTYANPTVYAGNLIAGSAILVQADNTTVTRVTGRNGWDNCIAVVQLPDSNPAQATPGRPVGYSISTTRTYSCGWGPTHIGAGIDIGSGSGGTVNDHVDKGSYAAFIHDIGAGANGTFSNLTGLNTKWDGTVPSYTFYVGGSDSTYTNLVSNDAGYRGLWVDATALKVSMTNVTIKAPARDGALIKSPTATITNLIVNSPGYGGPASDAIILDTSAGKIDRLNLINPMVLAEFKQARHGLFQVGTGSLKGSAINADLSGAATTALVPPTFSIVDTTSLGAAWTTYTPTITCTSGAPTATASGIYRRVGRTTDVQVNIPVIGVGTCKGALVATLPTTPAGRTSLSAVESVLTGAVLSAVAYENVAAIQIKKFDGSNPAIAGATLTVGGTYSSQ